MDRQSSTSDNGSYRNCSKIFDPHGDGSSMGSHELTRHFLKWFQSAPRPGQKRLCCGPGGNRTPVMGDLPQTTGHALIPLMNPNQALTRRRDPHRSDSWLIYLTDVHVGTIARAVGVPWGR